MDAHSVPIPEKEAQRLAALRAYEILDTAATIELEEIVNLASNICRTPLSAVSLVDQDRQFYLSKKGINVSETPRRVSFCQYTIMGDEIFVVNDASKDDRFSKSPLVVDDGTRFYAGMPLVTADGYALGSLCVLDRKPREITLEQKEALKSLGKLVVAQMELHRKNLQLGRQARELEMARENALEASRVKSVFLANISHEIRTPLNGVIGIASLLRETDLSLEQQEYTDIIRRSGENLLSVVNQVLDFAKIETGQAVLDSNEFELDKLMLDLMEPQRAAARQKGLSLKFAYHCQPQCSLKGDTDRFRQVLRSLIENAIKFTQEGGVYISAGIRQNKSHLAHVEIKIRDTGIGIPEERLSKVFEPFAQADGSLTRSFGGVGLGLSITHRLIQLMGGKITIDSRVGIGTVCTVTLDLPCVQLESSGSKTFDKWRNPAGLKVLIVEDSLVNMKVAATILTKKGLIISTAADGQQAVEAVRAHDFDLVFMDVQMPVMDGLEATTEIRKWEKAHKRKPLIIVGLTAHAMTEHRDICLASGMDDFMTKPVNIASFEAIFERLSRASLAAA